MLMSAELKSSNGELIPSMGTGRSEASGGEGLRE
jgi:hypothetical protein